MPQIETPVETVNLSKTGAGQIRCGGLTRVAVIAADHQRFAVVRGSQILRQIVIVQANGSGDMSIGERLPIADIDNISALFEEFGSLIRAYAFEVSHVHLHSHIRNVHQS